MAALHPGLEGSAVSEFIAPEELQYPFTIYICVPHEPTLDEKRLIWAGLQAVYDEDFSFEVHQSLSLEDAKRILRERREERS